MAILLGWKSTCEWKPDAQGDDDETTQEDVNMSLYAPINKNAEWKLSSSAESVWKETSFADASWTSVTLSSITQQLTGTQYLRKAFTV